MSNEVKVGVLLSTTVSSVCLILTPNSHLSLAHIEVHMSRCRHV